MKITRNVISDLWPLYGSGEASEDTRALVDEFLAADPEFGRTLKTEVPLPTAPISIPPDAEAVAFQRTRDLVKGHAWLRGLRLLAVVLTLFALRRVYSDTQWIRPVQVFLAEAILAVICWTAYVLLLKSYRNRALRTSPK